MSGYESDCRLLRRAWHLVGTHSDFAKPGDFLTLQVLGVPVQIRNFDGKLVALSNVCAHRHALICGQQRGNSSSMRCQYHGWEYRHDGTTGKIPKPKNFVPFEREQMRLESYAIEKVGQLVFVCIDKNPRSLKEQLDADMLELLTNRFGVEWSETLRWMPEYPVNWKIPLENSLESYHVPNVHPKTFREDPGDQHSEHLLLANRTAMTTSLPFSHHSRLDAMFQRLEGRLIAWMGYPVTGRYWQHHVFPNLLFSFTDAISLAHCLIPNGPQNCIGVVRQFGRLPRASGDASFKSLVAKVWGNMAAVLTRRIMLEDQQIFTQIQQGLEGSQKPGVLGICEERIYRFQASLQQENV